MRAQDIHAFLKRLPSDMEDSDSLIHTYGIHLVSCLQRFARFDELV